MDPLLYRGGNSYSELDRYSRIGRKAWGVINSYYKGIITVWVCEEVHHYLGVQVSLLVAA